MRAIHITAGQGLGEAAIGARLVRELVDRGSRVTSFVPGRDHAAIVSAVGAEVCALSAFSIEACLEADAVILSSSLTTGELGAMLGGIPTPAFATEHTWLPWITSASAWRVAAIRQFLVFMDPGVWAAGTSAEGGPFRVHASIAPRCTPVGWAWASTPGEPGERGLLYLGATEPAPGTRKRSLRNLLVETALRTLDAVPDLSWEVAGAAAVPDHPRIMYLGQTIPPERFAQRLARARVFLSHTTAGSMQQALAARVPIVAVSEGGVLAEGHRAEGAWADSEGVVWSGQGLIHHAFANTPSRALAALVLAAMEAPRPATRAGGGARVAADLVEAACREPRRWPGRWSLP